jgi:hypothetical protein
MQISAAGLSPHALTTFISESRTGQNPQGTPSGTPLLSRERVGNQVRCLLP